MAGKSPTRKKRAKKKARKASRASTSRKRPGKSPAPADKALTPRQTAFVRWYTTPGETLFNGTKSADKSGYRGSENVLAAQAYENLRKPHIGKAIQAEIKRQYGAADLTVEKVLRDIELVRQAAVRDADYSAALRASDLHGKYLKMWTQKIEHLHTIEDASTEELLTLLSQIVGNIDGVDLTRLLGGDGAAAGGAPDPQGTPTTH